MPRFFGGVDSGADHKVAGAIWRIRDHPHEVKCPFICAFVEADKANQTSVLTGQEHKLLVEVAAFKLAHGRAKRAAMLFAPKLRQPLPFRRQGQIAPKRCASTRSPAFSAWRSLRRSWRCEDPASE